MTRFILGAILIWFAIPPAFAAPQRYNLDAKKSSVGFAYHLGKQRNKGTMPIKSADIRIDFRALQRSQINVTLHVRKAKTGFIFATEALRGKSVLNVKAFPLIRFTSKSVRRAGNGAVVKGLVTIRGVTKPLTLTAQFFRAGDDTMKDLSKIAVLLTGSIQRSEFGASGYSDLVSDRIDLRILAYMNKSQ